jgi:transcription initiation factor TFIIF subunit alpha
MADQNDFDDEDGEESDGEKLTSTGKEIRKIIRNIDHDAVPESDNEKDPYAESVSQDRHDG